MNMLDRNQGFNMVYFLVSSHGYNVAISVSLCLT